MRPTTRPWPWALRLGLAVTATLACAFAVAPWLWPLSGGDASPLDAFAAPSWGHPLGCDDEGRDVLARLLAGGRLASAVGGGVALLAVGGGGLLGAVAGWRGGWLDALVRRVADVAMAFPGLLLALLVLFVSERPGVWTVVLSLSATGWAQHARVVRGLVLQVRHRDDLRAARYYDSSDARVLWHFVLPAIAGPMAVQAAFAAASAVIGEASLSFLGLGPQGVVSWGGMLQHASAVFLQRPSLLWTVAATLVAWQIGLTLIADGLRDVLDPRWPAPAPPAAVGLAPRPLSAQRK